MFNASPLWIRDKKASKASMVIIALWRDGLGAARAWCAPVCSRRLEYALGSGELSPSLLNPRRAELVASKFTWMPFGEFRKESDK